MKPSNKEEILKIFTVFLVMASLIVPNLWAGTQTKPPVVSVSNPIPTQSAQPAAAVKSQDASKGPSVETGISQGPLAPAKRKIRTAEQAVQKDLKRKKLKGTINYEKPSLENRSVAYVTAYDSSMPGDGRTPRQYFIYTLEKNPKTGDYKVISSRRASDREAYQIGIFNLAKGTRPDLKMDDVVITSVSAPSKEGVRKIKVQIAGEKFTAEARKVKSGHFINKLMPEQKGDNRQFQPAEVTQSSVHGGAFPGSVSIGLTFKGVQPDFPVTVEIEIKEGPDAEPHKETHTITKDGSINFRYAYGRNKEGREAYGYFKVLSMKQNGQDLKPEIENFYAS